MSKTYLDELTEYPSIAIKNIGEDKTVVGLLLDDPTVEVGSEKADSVLIGFYLTTTMSTFLVRSPLRLLALKQKCQRLIVQL